MNVLKLTNETALLSEDCKQSLDDLRVLEAAKLSKRSALAVDRLMVRLAYMQKKLDAINAEASSQFKAALDRHNAEPGA